MNDELCNEFEDALRMGQQPKIAQFLLRIPADQQAALVEELLKIELLQRREGGEQPQPADYLSELADFENLVRRVVVEQAPTLVPKPQSALKVRCPHCHQPIEILESDSYSEVNCDSCGNSFTLLGKAETAAYEQGVGEMIGHFTLQEKLGSGAFGTVWKAYDATLKRTVALKVPRSREMSPEAAESHRKRRINELKKLGIDPYRIKSVCDKPPP